MRSRKIWATFIEKNLSIKSDTLLVGLQFGQFFEAVGRLFSQNIWSPALAAWYTCIVVTAAAFRTEYPGFKSRQGIKFVGKHSIAVVYKMT
jgi:hypothetical protein